MHTLLHRHCAKYIYILPDGLRELMSDISREVLRTQPEEMYTFIADYLDALMITRENARVASRLVECITEIGRTTAELLLQIGISRQQADHAAELIQIAFRRHMDNKREFEREELGISIQEEEEYFTNKILDECEIDYGRANQAASLIQEAYRRFRQHTRHEHDLLLGLVDWRVAARSAIYLYRHTGVSHFEAHRAATLIKAAYKGYYTRKVMQRLLEEGHLDMNGEMERILSGLDLDQDPKAGLDDHPDEHDSDKLHPQQISAYDKTSTTKEYTSTSTKGHILNYLHHYDASEEESSAVDSLRQRISAQPMFKETRPLAPPVREVRRVSIPKTIMESDSPTVTAELTTDDNALADLMPEKPISTADDTTALETLPSDDVQAATRSSEEEKELDLVSLERGDADEQTSTRQQPVTETDTSQYQDNTETTAMDMTTEQTNVLTTGEVTDDTEAVTTDGEEIDV